MREKMDIIIIILTYLIELFIMSFLRYSQYMYCEYEIIKLPNAIFNFCFEADFLYSISNFFNFLFFILGFTYILSVLFKIKSGYIVNLRKNNFYLLFLMINELLFYLIEIKIMIINSHVFRFVIICLLTNLVVYIKYKKNNIKIK